MTALTLVSLAVGLSASVEDLAKRRISNWIPIAAALAGFAIHIHGNGWKGAVSAALGFVAGFCVFLAFYLLGGMGGGDVKLMAGFGAIVGIERLLAAALWTAGIGGIMACAALGIRGWKRWRRQQSDGDGVGDNREPDNEPDKSIPYAPAIAMGALLSLVP
ncbi:MAG: A24 family peptidase [Bryobacteraceae bacterium]